MSDHQPFLDAIIESPDDENAYLVYADWLEEQGDPRGEFIRIQCQLESHEVPESLRKELKEREGLLLSEHVGEWLGAELNEELVRLASPWSKQPTFEFRRGFLNGVFVAIDEENEIARLLLASPAAKLLERFHILGGMISRSDFESFPRGDIFPNVRSLRLLDLWEGDMTDVAAYLDRMPNIEELELEVRRADSTPLFEYPLKRLKLLTVDHLDNYNLQALANNTSLRNLESISFYPHMLEPDDDMAYINRENFVALCRSSNLPNLQHVEIMCSEIGDEGLRIALETGFLQRLNSLNLCYGTVTDSGARMLAEADLPNLQYLNLTGNYLTQSGVETLQAMPAQTETQHQHTSDIRERQHLWYGDME